MGLSGRATFFFAASRSKHARVCNAKNTVYVPNRQGADPGEDDPDPDPT